MSSTSDKKNKVVGVQVLITFDGERAHAFESFPSEPSPTLFQTEATTCPHAFSGTLDGGERMTPLKNTGPMALLVRALMDAKDSSETFLSAQVKKLA